MIMLSCIPYVLEGVSTSVAEYDDSEADVDAEADAFSIISRLTWELGLRFVGEF